MWAAGVILYILLCGFPPFRSPERDQDELFNIIQVGQFEFLSPYWDNISDGEITPCNQKEGYGPLPTPLKSGLERYLEGVGEV
jgi:serine/threonine protein kinase